VGVVTDFRKFSGHPRYVIHRISAIFGRLLRRAVSVSNSWASRQISFAGILPNKFATKWSSHNSTNAAIRSLV